MSTSIPNKFSSTLALKSLDTVSHEGCDLSFSLTLLQRRDFEEYCLRNEFQ
jgi:hypothetical protein